MMATTGNALKTCPSRDDLVLFYHADLNKNRMDDIQSHVESCDSCIVLLDAQGEESDTLVQALSALSDTTDDEIEFQRMRDELLTRPEDVDATLSVGELTDGHDAWLNPLHRIGQTIDDYELTNLLGHGANGCVYKARHQKLGRLFAIKLLAPRDHNQLDSVRRFLDEMKAVGRLDHPNIVKATDAGEFQGQHYFVMEYVEGIDVSALVRKLGPLPAADAAEIIRRAALGLQFAHDNGMVHRDVKPSNLLFDLDGDVKVLDLGLVSMAESTEQDLSGVVCRGTADYMSPEQWRDYRKLDGRADIYSLGCTLFKLLTGFAPFARESNGIGSKMHAHQSAPFPSARKHNPHVPLGLDRLIRHMTNKNVADRLATMNDVAEKLKSYAADSDLRRLGSVYATGAGLASLNVDQPLQPIRRVSRRTVLAASCAGLATVFFGQKLFGRRGKGLQTGQWRSLFPADDRELFSLSNSSNARLDPVSDSIQVTASDSTLFPLGNPVAGKFLFEATLSVTPEQPAAGVFFRYRRAKQTIGMLHPFQTIQLRQDSNGELQVMWRDYRWLIAKSESNLEELPWGTARVRTTSRQQPIVLTVNLGSKPLPTVAINGIDIGESDWTFSREGAQTRQMTRDRLRSEYMGQIGLFTAGAPITFSRIRLKYLT